MNVIWVVGSFYFRFHFRSQQTWNNTISNNTDKILWRPWRLREFMATYSGSSFNMPCEAANSCERQECTNWKSESVLGASNKENAGVTLWCELMNVPDWFHYYWLCVTFPQNRIFQLAMWLWLAPVSWKNIITQQFWYVETSGEWDLSIYDVFRARK